MVTYNKFFYLNIHNPVSASRKSPTKGNEWVVTKVFIGTGLEKMN